MPLIRLLANAERCAEFLQWVKAEGVASAVNSPSELRGQGSYDGRLLCGCRCCDSHRIESIRLKATLPGSLPCGLKETGGKSYELLSGNKTKVKHIAIVEGRLCLWLWPTWNCSSDGHIKNVWVLGGVLSVNPVGFNFRDYFWSLLMAQ